MTAEIPKPRVGHDPPWKALIGVFLSGLGVFLSFGTLLPLFPRWTAQFTDSMTQVGVATTLAAGVGLVAARPIAARLMEGKARMPTLMVGALATGISSAVYPFIGTLTLIMVVRVVQGLGFGLVTTAAVSAITDMTPPHRRGEVMGYFGASNALALLLGPLLGGTVHKFWGFDVAFWVSAALVVPSLILARRVKEPPAVPLPPGSFRLLDALKLPSLRVIAGGHFLGVMLHGALLVFVPLLIASRQGWMSVEAFFAIEAAAVIAFRVIFGRKFDAYDPMIFVRGGLVGLVISALLLGLGESDWLVLLAAIAYGLGFGSYVPTINAIVGNVVPPTHRARGFAVFMLAFDLAIAGGGVIFGPIADKSGPSAALLLAASAPALALLVFLIGGNAMRPAPARRARRAAS
ncbi:MAG: MFS transporter [Myxococcales bacterium]|nr:MFS transporter [Myxococcales bacterium]